MQYHSISKSYAKGFKNNAVKFIKGRGPPTFVLTKNYIYKTVHIDRPYLSILLR